MAFGRSAVDLTLHRFYVPDSLGDTVSFSVEQGRQIHRVLRLRAGDRVIAFNGDGNDVLVQLDLVREGIAHGWAQERVPNGAEPATHLTLYQGLLKGAKLDFVLQKGTELGVSSFVPVSMGRSIPSRPSQERQRRYEAIVREAAEQCGRAAVPTVSEARPFDEALSVAATRGEVLVLWEGRDGTCSLRDVEISDRVSMFVGPEGGLTEDEVVRARDAGARLVSLGRRILRAETAALIGTALVLARAGDLG